MYRDTTTIYLVEIVPMLRSWLEFSNGFSNDFQSLMNFLEQVMINLYIYIYIYGINLMFRQCKMTQHTHGLSHELFIPV